MSGRQTCSYSCSNKMFRTGTNHGLWTGKNYAVICFSEHKRECIICGEDKIVGVHHYDENHKNNSVDNLVPLCPTHHQYYHSRYQYLVKDIIDAYVKEFKNNVSRVWTVPAHELETLKVTVRLRGETP